MSKNKPVLFIDFYAKNQSLNWQKRKIEKIQKNAKRKSYLKTIS